ncbi:MAG: ABC transporter ATP-binding protein [Candidatus Accumulibacter sp.]|jgi:peptide/nickel transport system ATP-binding protein|nr:ABC transporter ATP-binding protein [Accumulibacter sp.]
MSGAPLLSVDDLKVGFVSGRKTLTAVSGVSFSVKKGETLALIGESGCGKSVTALSLLRLLPPAGRILGGSVRFNGNDLLRLPEAAMRGVRGRGISMIFQEASGSLNPVLTVGRQITEALRRRPGLEGVSVSARTLELLDAVGITGAKRRLDEYPFQLSGGIKQRVMIAMALAADPELLIADEPTTALDVTIQAQILDLLLHLQEERGMGILLITHDFGVAGRMARRIGVMYAGEIVEEAAREDFFRYPRHPYTRKLFAALPDGTRRSDWLETIPGQVPSLSELPEGCRFAARCSRTSEICRDVSPAWTDAENGSRIRCHAPWDEPVSRKSPEEKTTPLRHFDSSPSSPLLTVKDLCVYFPVRGGIFRHTVGQARAVDGVSFRLERGRTLALVGESGCGKTTAGKAILQLIPSNGGQVELDGIRLKGLSGEALRRTRRRMQMIFQDPFASLDPRMRVGEIISEGMKTFDTASVDMADAVAALLAQVGLPRGAESRYPHEFSGGQRQRIAIARAIAVQPELIICDEPTSALDVSVQAQILNLLKSLQNELGLAYLFITHNFAVVGHLAHEVAVMYLGRIVERGETGEVLKSPAHPYTQALLSSILPVDGVSGNTGKFCLSGEVSPLAQPARACLFHPRCPRATDACKEIPPKMHALSTTHSAACHLPG